MTARVPCGHRHVRTNIHACMYTSAHVCTYSQMRVHEQIHVYENHKRKADICLRMRMRVCMRTCALLRFFVFPVVRHAHMCAKSYSVLEM